MNQLVRTRKKEAIEQLRRVNCNNYSLWLKIKRGKRADCGKLYQRVKCLRGIDDLVINDHERAALGSSENQRLVPICKVPFFGKKKCVF